VTSDLAAFFVAFAVVGLLELVDRTNLALIGLASRQPWRPTWAGAATAFVASSAIAVAVGTAFLSAFRGEIKYVQIGGGVFLLAYAAYLAVVPESERAPPSGRSAFAAAFLLIFSLELGDDTWIVLIVLTGSLGDPLEVFGAGALALIAVATLGASIGARLGARVPPVVLERAVVAILTVVGLLTILVALGIVTPPALFG